MEVDEIAPYFCNSTFGWNWMVQYNAEVSKIQIKFLKMNK